MAFKLRIAEDNSVLHENSLSAQDFSAIKEFDGEGNPRERAASQKSSFVKSDYDRDRIIFARDYMLQHMDMPPTIPELARIAGINEFKLKKGYKEIFGTTIFGHLAEARLQMAKEALQEGKKSISAIAFDLGYSSVQHFSVSFRKRFGITPGQVK